VAACPVNPPRLLCATASRAEGAAERTRAGARAPAQGKVPPQDRRPGPMRPKRDALRRRTRRAAIAPAGAPGQARRKTVPCPARIYLHQAEGRDHSLPICQIESISTPLYLPSGLNQMMPSRHSISVLQVLCVPLRRAGVVVRGPTPDHRQIRSCRIGSGACLCRGRRWVSVTARGQVQQRPAGTRRSGGDRVGPASYPSPLLRCTPRHGRPNMTTAPTDGTSGLQYVLSVDLVPVSTGTRSAWSWRCFWLQPLGPGNASGSTTEAASTGSSPAAFGPTPSTESAICPGTAGRPFSPSRKKKPSHFGSPGNSA